MMLTKYGRRGPGPLARVRTPKGSNERRSMQYSQEVENMCPVTKGAYHGPAPIPEEGK